jgi:uncharacterized protein (TIGR01244 family)
MLSLHRPLYRHLVVLSLLVLAGCSDSTPQAGLDVSIMNRADPLPGITTSGQPDEAALQGLADAGYAAVIDLRGADEDRGFDEKSAVEGLGMSYISLPITGRDAINYDNASALDEVLKDIDGPVLLHCASSNRVGALLTLRDHMHGASSEESLELGTEAGLASLRETVEARLSER